MATTGHLLERDAELATLESALVEAAAGRGGVVVVSGEAGIGKSSLVSRFVDSLGAETRALVGACDDLSIPRPLAPFRDLAGAVGPTLADAIAARAPHEIYQLLLGELDSPRPTVLVLEDVHWADDATLDAATFLVRRIGGLRALLIVTVRDGESPPGETLHAMLGAAATAQARFMQLAPLSPAAVDELASGTRADVHAATGGNPFLVTELLSSEDGSLPATVASVVRARARHLDAPSRALVDLLSVVPGRVPTHILDLLSPGWPKAAEEPERRRLLEVTPTHVQFRHELVRLAVRSTLGTTAARDLNARIVDVLIACDWDPTDIVHHAEAAGMEDVVAAYVLRAARRAAKLESNREAYAHYRRALDFSELLTPPEQAALRDEYSAAAYYAGHLEEALAGIRAAIHIYRDQGDMASFGRCTRMLSRLLWFAGDGPGAHATARAAIAILEPLGPSIDLAAAYSTRARLAMLRREISVAETWGGRALELAERFDDVETRVQALVTLASARLLVDPDATAGLQEAHDAAHAAEDREEATRALANLAYTLLSWGRADAALEAAHAGTAYADKHEVHHMAPYNVLIGAWLDLRAGRWADAERTASAYVGSKVTIHRLLATTVLAELAVRRGDDDADDRLAALWTKAEQTAELQRLAPLLELSVERALLRGDPPPSDVLLEHLAGSPPHAEDVVRLAAWASVAGIQTAIAAPAPTPWEPMLRRDWCAAADAFADAGWQYDRALMLSLAGDGAALLDAIGIAHALGAAPLARRVAQQLRALGLRVPRGPRESTRANRAGLTGRQLEVLSLLAEGLTNVEIADRLVVSPRTAEHHVAAVLQKLGAPTRRDAVRRATTEGT